MRILLIEDDIDMASTVQAGLEHNYIVDLADSSENGIYKIMVNEYDLVILDIMLPDGSGIDVCKTIRERNKKMPVLMLTAKSAVEQKVAAFNAGADDYLTKPFNFVELMARVQALLRRPTDVFISNPLTIGDLSIDTASYEVKWREKSILLRRKEFQLLEYLARHHGEVVTRSMILEHVWDAETDPLSNTVDVHINFLRAKIDRPLKKQVIKTVSGVGYKLKV